MKKKNLLYLLLIPVLSFSVFCSGCASQKEDASSGTASEESSSDDGSGGSLSDDITSENSITLEGSLDTEQTLSGGTITVPSYLQGEEIKELSPIEESDDSATYDFSSVQQSELVNEMALQLQNSITEVLSDKKYYPHITKISVNEACSEFTVSFSSRELTTYETALRLSLYLAGDKYQLYSGIPEDTLLTAVHYQDASSGEIFSTGTSKELH